jgi:hypothetical protein
VLLPLSHPAYSSSSLILHPHLLPLSYTPILYPSIIYPPPNLHRSMLQSEVDSLRSQLGGGGRIGPSAAEMQLQQMNQALTQSHRDREELLAYITKISQQRVTQESNVMNDHSRGRFNDSLNNGNYQHQQQISSNNGGSEVLCSELLHSNTMLNSFMSDSSYLYLSDSIFQVGIIILMTTATRITCSTIAT